MIYDYIALIFFALFGIFIPVSFLLSAKLLGKHEPGNPVKNAPYESAEETIGGSRDIDNEYLSYFALFLPFEIVAVVVLLWSEVAYSLPLPIDLLYLGLPMISMLLMFAAYKLINDKHG